MLGILVIVVIWLLHDYQDAGEPLSNFCSLIVQSTQYVSKSLVGKRVNTVCFLICCFLKCVVGSTGESLSHIMFYS